MKPARSDVAALLALLALAGGVAADAWTSSVQWKPDSLFYRSQVLRLKGVGKEEALRRVFEGPLAAPRRASEASLPPAERKVGNPEWVRYSSQFYERRWVVPVVAAALDPALGAEGLLAASWIGYGLVAALLYLLLRLWFPVPTALLASATCLLLQPLRYWSSLPLTDSWGVAALCLALAAGALLLVHGLRWLPLWALAVLALSFTRDASAIVAAGAVVAFAVRPHRLTALLGLTGILASLPAPLLFGAPLRESMAYTLNDFYPAADPSWGFVADHYLDGIRDLVRNNLEWLGDHPVEALVLVGGFLFLPFLRRRASAATPFLYGAAVASLVYVLVVPNYTAFRLELVFLPFAALGLASAFMLLDRPLGALNGRARTRAARARGRAGAA